MLEALLTIAGVLLVARGVIALLALVDRHVTTTRYAADMRARLLRRRDERRRGR